MSIQLVVGLGNPGTSYQATRHNAGVWFVEALAQAHHISFREEKRFRSKMAELSTKQGKILLLLPQTFMNLSGDAVQAALHYFQIPLSALLVAHDELDLPCGVIKLKQGGGHAGHNGLKDIIAKGGGNDFWRLRVGIDHPRSQSSRQEVADYVLSKPSVDDRIEMIHAIDRAVGVAPLFLEGAFAEAMRQLHASPP